MKTIANHIIDEAISQVPILIQSIDPRETDLKVLNAKRRCQRLVSKLKKYQEENASSNNKEIQ